MTMISDFIFKIIILPDITVTTPNGGEILKAGSLYSITWSSTNVENVKIEYTVNGGVNWNTILESTDAAEGKFTWTVPNTPSENCVVKIRDATDSTVFDQSNEVLEITPKPTIIVTSPYNNEHWQVGSIQSIQWIHFGVNNVTIKYSIDNGARWKTISENIPALQGSYEWIVPDTPSSSCLVKIIATSNASVYDQSYNRFSIIRQEIPIIITSELSNAMVGVEYADSIEVEYPEVEGDITFELIESPEWMTINNTGVLSGMPTVGDEGIDIPVSIRVVNESELADTLSTVLTVQANPVIDTNISFDQVFHNSGYQGGGSVINNPGPGERFGFAVYLKNNTLTSGFTIDLKWDGAKASFRNAQSGPRIFDDIYDINRMPDVEFAEETNILLSDDTGSMSSIVGADEEGHYKVSWAKLGGESITISEGLLYLAVFKTANDFSVDDMLTISVDVTVSDDKGNEYPLQGKEFKVGSEIAPPSSVTITDIPGDQGHSLEIEWSLSPDDATISHYNIYRSRFPYFTDHIALESFITLDELIAAEQNSTILIESVPRGETSYLDMTVPVSNAEYYYWLQAMSENGASEKVTARNVITSVESMPTGLRLNVPYPNPFNPTTTIDYYLSQDIYITLEIYNISGQKVDVLKDGIAETGYHSIVWNAEGMPSGIYFCRLTTDDFIDMKKMLLLK